MKPWLQAGTQYWLVVAPPDLRNTVFQWLLSPQPNLEILSTSELQNIPWDRSNYAMALAFGVYGIESAGPQPAIGTGGVVGRLRISSAMPCPSRSTALGC